MNEYTNLGSFLRRWVPSILMVTVIFFFSSIPSKELPGFGSFDVFVKKGGHALGYGLLAATFWYGFNWTKKLWWVALLMAAVYAVADELHQTLVPGRHPSPVDVALDSTSAAIALAISAIVKRTKRA